MKYSVTRDPTLQYIPIWQNLLAVFKLNLHSFDVLSLFCSCFLLLRENTQQYKSPILVLSGCNVGPSLHLSRGSEFCISKYAWILFPYRIQQCWSAQIDFTSRIQNLSSSLIICCCYNSVEPKFMLLNKTSVLMYPYSQDRILNEKHHTLDKSFTQLH